MKNKILIFLLLSLLAAGKCYSQTQIAPTFLSSSKKYEFTLPQFDISVPLPAKAQFRVPLFTGKNIKLEVDDITRYYFDPEYLKKPQSFTFCFALSSQEKKDLLYMNIFLLNKSEIEKKINAAIDNSNSKRISSIRTKLGKSISYESTQKDGKTSESHIISKGEFSFVFTLNGDMDKNLKKQYLKIIKSFKEKNQPYLKVRYETRVKNGEFEPTQKEDKKAVIELNENEGRLHISSFFEWPELGYGIQVPQKWEYKVEGELTSEKDDFIKVLLPKSYFEDNFMTMNWFRNDEVVVNFRSYRDMDVAKVIDQQSQRAKYIQKVDIVVDGIPIKACYYGSEEYGNLDFCFDAKEKNHWVSFSGINKHTLRLLEQMLTTIKIENNKPGKTNVIIPVLSAQLKLHDLSPVRIDQPLNIDHNWPEVALFECDLVDLNIGLRLPGKQSDYMYTIGSLKGAIKDGAIKGVPENETDKRLMLFSMAGSPLSFSVSKKLKTIPYPKYIMDIKRGWSIYNDAEVIHGSITSVNGLEWGVCIMRNSTVYFTMLSSQVGDYEIMVSGRFENKEEAFKSIAYLKNVVYKKVSGH